jgi:hypothetical protein
MGVIVNLYQASLHVSQSFEREEMSDATAVVVFTSSFDHPHN